VELPGETVCSKINELEDVLRTVKFYRFPIIFRAFPDAEARIAERKVSRAEGVAASCSKC